MIEQFKSTIFKLSNGLFSVVLALFASSASAQAQNFPNKPIRIVVSQNPGGTTDATARAFADYFSQKFGVPVSVENRPGAGGTIAGELVAHSPADGYTLFVCLHSQMAQAPVLFKKPLIDPDRDLVPVAALTAGGLPMMVRTSLGVNSVKELVELSKKQAIKAGNYSIGSGWHLLLSQLTRETGGEFIIVSYKGTPAMLTDLVGEQTDVATGSFVSVAPFINRPNIKALAVMSDRRSVKYPDIPTWVEAGFTSPAFSKLLEYNMLLAPAGTPPAILEILSQAAAESDKKGAKVQDVKDTIGSDEPVLVGEPLRKMIAEVWPVYRTLTSQLGLTPE